MNSENVTGRKVFLFSGHMIDAADRDKERFPEKLVEAVSARIASLLNELSANNDDIGICGGACGGDLLFASACLELGMKFDIYIPFLEPAFLEMSVNYAGQKWIDLYNDVKNNPQTTIHEMPLKGIQNPDGLNDFELNNRWMINTTLSYGVHTLYFICLWDGSRGDGSGGTQSMYNAVKAYTDRIYVINTDSLNHP